MFSPSSGLSHISANGVITYCGRPASTYMTNMTGLKKIYFTYKK
jgi:hypothetical protein